MSDTQKIVDELLAAVFHISRALEHIDLLPRKDRKALEPSKDMLIASRERLGRRIAAHSNALEVQS